MTAHARIRPSVPTWRTAWRCAAVGTAAVLFASCAHNEPGGESVLRNADRVMGAGKLKTLHYAGTGTGATFGQAYQPGMAWPKLTYSSYSRQLDYENGALREDFARSRAETTGGGAVPLMGTGEQRASGFMRGTHAWNMVGPAPVPAPVALDARIHDLWTTPHGIVKMAQKNNAKVRGDGELSKVTFEEPGRFSAVVWITPGGLVERVESVQPNAVLGDTKLVTLYSDYRDFAGGIKFPTRIRQTQGGFPVLDLQVQQVEANAAVAIEVPALVPAFTERVTVEKAAEGVWFLAGGSHNSVAIEMRDHLILVESPLYDGRALAVLAEAKKLAPGKPVRYVINSHHHFDHAGGLRAAASEGATLVTSEQARWWFQGVLANPNSINPDALAKSGRFAQVRGVNGQLSLGDASRAVEVFMIADSGHAEGFMMVWLPRERLLIEADGYTPGAPNAPAPAQPNANNVNLVQNIETLKLNVERILPLHGRIVPIAELYTAIGRK